MDGVNLIYKLKKQVEETQKNVQTAILNGQVDNYRKIPIYDRTASCLRCNFTGNLYPANGQGARR